MLSDVVDRALKTREVALLEGVCTRSLAEWVKAGKFPPPDLPASGRGAPDRWLESTIRKARDARIASARASRAIAADATPEVATKAVPVAKPTRRRRVA